MKLTDTQLVILSAASQRQDCAIELAPNSKGGAAYKVVGNALFPCECRVKHTDIRPRRFLFAVFATGKLPLMTAANAANSSSKPLILFIGAP
jgi:hypothetical protein